MSRKEPKTVTIDGETKTVKEWCKIFKISESIAYRRIREGDKGTDIFRKGYIVGTTSDSRRICLGGRVKAFKTWQKEFGTGDKETCQKIKELIGEKGVEVRGRGWCSETLCWFCQNVLNGSCSWFLDFTPVEGWVAVPSKVLSSTKVNHKEIPVELDSFLVIGCPNFIEDEPRDIKKQPINDCLK